MTFVELTQDVIHGERAKTALLSMAERSGLEADNGLFQNWQEDRGYRFGELRQLFEEWQSNKLKTEVYPQYASETAANKLVQKVQAPGQRLRQTGRNDWPDQSKRGHRPGADYYKAQKAVPGEGHLPRAARHAHGVHRQPRHCQNHCGPAVRPNHEREWSAACGRFD